MKATETPRRAVVLLAIAVTVATTIYFVRGFPVRHPLDLDEADHRALLGRSDGPEYFAALLRRSRVGDEAAKRPAIQAAQSADPLLKQAAAQALAFYSGSEADSALLLLTRDRNPAVRIPAIESLGGSSSPSRKAELARLEIDSDALSRAAARVAELRQARDPDSKAMALARIAEIVGATGTGSDEMARNLAFQRALSLEPTHPTTLKMARGAATKGPADLARSAIRHLAFMGDPWFLTNYPSLLAERNEPEVRANLLETMHQVCPKDRWEALDRIIREESDPGVRAAALHQAAIMSSPESQALLRKWIAFKRLKMGEPESVEATLARMEKHPSVDPCSQPRFTAEPVKSK